MRLRGNPRKQLMRNLSDLLDSRGSTRVRVDKMEDQKIRERIAAIKMWDTLKKFQCPMCLKTNIKLDSKADLGFNLRCPDCGAHYAMSTSRSLGAKLVVR